MQLNHSRLTGEGEGDAKRALGVYFRLIKAIVK